MTLGLTFADIADIIYLNLRQGTPDTVGRLGRGAATRSHHHERHVLRPV